MNPWAVTGAAVLAGLLTTAVAVEHAGRKRAEAGQASAQAQGVVAVGQANVLARDLQACGAAAQIAASAGERKLAEVQNALAGLRRRAQANAAALERLKVATSQPAPPGASCEVAWDMIEQAEANR